MYFCTSLAYRAMPFVKELLNYRSLSIVGLEKNTGKTVCLNYILRRLNQLGVPCAVTSIGVDGEQVDAVFGSAKPEVTLYDGTLFITSEKHYRLRRLVSQIEAVDTRRTALGRMVTARVVVGGKALLSGAASTPLLREQIDRFVSQGVPLTIVDGALSRLSLASPTVTDAMVMATGAAVSVSLPQLVARTRFACSLIQLDEVDGALRASLSQCGAGLWAVDDEGGVHDLHIASALMLNQNSADIFAYGNTLFAAGAVTDRLVKHLSARQDNGGTQLIVRDFTKLFISPETLRHFYSCGGSLRVLNGSRLVAVCLNPTSPQGFTLNSDEACHAVSEAIGLPVYDVMRQPF